MSTSTAKGARPLSPHWSIYRWPITMVLSIVHRISGLLLSLAFLLLVAWLFAAASGPAAYAAYAEAAGSLPGRALAVVVSLAFFFHLVNGIRHLVWDLGFGFEIPQANASSWVTIAATVMLTASFWLLLAGAGT